MENLNQIGDYKIHPLCMLFPWFDEDHMEALKESLQKQGQYDTIKLFFEGEEWIILDGKNRMRALKDLDIEPKFEKLPKDINPIAFVKAEGLCRRDLDPFTRIEIAQKLEEFEEEQLPEEEKEKIKEWKKDPKKVEILEKKKIDKIKKEAKSNEDTVKKVLEIKETLKNKPRKKREKAEKVIKKVKEGKKTVSQAHKEIVGETKKKKPHKPHQYTRAELEEQLREAEITIKRLENINQRLITYLKEGKHWDEIKHEFGVVEMIRSVEPTPKQLREAEQL